MFSFFLLVHEPKNGISFVIKLAFASTAAGGIIHNIFYYFTLKYFDNSFKIFWKLAVKKSGGLKCISLEDWGPQIRMIHCGCCVQNNLNFSFISLRQLSNARKICRAFRCPHCQVRSECGTSEGYKQNGRANLSALLTTALTLCMWIFNIDSAQHILSWSQTR